MILQTPAQISDAAVQVQFGVEIAGPSGPGPWNQRFIDNMRRNQLMGIVVLGSTVDSQARCVYYSSKTDVVAIKFKCCGSYYPRFLCYRDCADHQAEQWSTGE